MKYVVALYDKFENLPLRGLLRVGTDTLVFLAHMLDDEPEQIAARRGMYARLQAFECSAELRSLFEKKDTMFRQWRACFDRGEVAKDTHPLYTSKEYCDLSSRANELTNSLISPALEQVGLFWIEDGMFVFESVEI